jgi:hypothetical protein
MDLDVRRNFRKKLSYFRNSETLPAVNYGYQFITNKEKALAISNQRLKLKNTALVEEAYQFYGPIFSFPPRVSHDGLRVVLESLAQRTSGTKFETNVDKYVDERLLDELEREGVFKRISGKG